MFNSSKKMLVFAQLQVFLVKRGLYVLLD